MVCEKLRRGKAWDSYSQYMHKEKQGGAHGSDTQPAKKKHRKASQKPSNAAIIRPASFHGPFSRYLLRLELQSVGLKLEEGKEKQDPFEKHKFNKSRTREQRKEMDREDTASDRNRNAGAGNLSTGNQENGTKNPPRDPQGVRTRKKSTNNANITNQNPDHELPLSKTAKDHTKGNNTAATKGHQENDRSKIISGDNMHKSKKPAPKKHGSSRNNTSTQPSQNHPNNQADPSTKTRGRKEDSDSRSKEHHKRHSTARKIESHSLDDNETQSSRSTRTRGRKEKSSSSTNKRKHSNTTVDAHDVNTYTKSRDGKDNSINSLAHKEHPRNTVNTKDTPKFTHIRGANRTNTHETSRKSDKERREEKSSERAGKTDSAEEERSRSKRRHKGPDLLAGAPRIRQILSLSPERHKGRIWAPLNLSSDTSKAKTKPKEATQGSLHKEQVHSHQGGSKNEQEKKSKHETGERSREQCKTGRSKHQKEWEDARLAMLLGPQIKGTSDKGKEWQKDAYERQSNVTSDSQTKQRSLKPLPAENEPRQTDTTGHTTEALPGRDRTPETTKNKIQESEHLDNRRPKLSTYTRKIYIIESGLSFARERKDKTPYLDRSFGTPWLGSTLIKTPGSSISSSKTPTDPTLEGSCEDPFGSQGTELHLNTPLQNMTNDHNQENREKTVEMEAKTTKVNVNMNPSQLFSPQYASQVLYSSPSTIQNLEEVRKWVARKNYSELASDKLQFLAGPASDENKLVDSTYPGPISSQWHGAHTNPTSLPQHQYVTQEGNCPDETSLGFKRMDLFTDDHSKITHTQEALLGRKHNPDTPHFAKSHTSHITNWGQFGISVDQSQAITENGGHFPSNVEIQTDHPGDLHPQQAKQHASSIPMYHFMAQDYDTNQDAIHSPNSAVSMSQGIYADNMSLFKHCGHFLQPSA